MWQWGMPTVRDGTTYSEKDSQLQCKIFQNIAHVHRLYRRRANRPRICAWHGTASTHLITSYRCIFLCESWGTVGEHSTPHITHKRRSSTIYIRPKDPLLHRILMDLAAPALAVLRNITTSSAWIRVAARLRRCEEVTCKTWSSHCTTIHSPLIQQ